MKIKILTILCISSFCLGSMLFSGPFQDNFDSILTNPLHENFIRLQEPRKAVEVSDNFFQMMEKPENWTVFVNDKGLPEYSFQKTQYDGFDNLKYVHALLDDLSNELTSSIFSVIGTEFMLNKGEKTYSFYSKINLIRKNYLRNKNKMRYFIHKIRDITEYSDVYLEDKKKEGMQSLFEAKRVAYTDENFFLLKRMVHKLNGQCANLWQNITVNLDQFLQEIKEIHLDLNKTDKQKIAEFMVTAAHMMEFNKSVITKSIEKVKTFSYLIYNSPKYLHVNEMYIEEIEKQKLQGQIYSKIENETDAQNKERKAKLIEKNNSQEEERKLNQKKEDNGLVNQDRNLQVSSSFIVQLCMITSLILFQIILLAQK